MTQAPTVVQQVKYLFKAKAKMTSYYKKYAYLICISR